MLIDVDDDARLLLVAFGLLTTESRSALLEQACVAATTAVAGEAEAERYRRSWPDRMPPVQPTPELLASCFLVRCMPPMPCGCGEDAFRYAYQDRAGSMVEQRARRIVLCSTALDETHADELLCDLWECAQIVGPDYGAPDYDHPHGPEVTGDDFLDIADTRAFVENWRENFEDALLALAPDLTSDDSPR
jgi:hypothetical protein